MKTLYKNPAKRGAMAPWEITEAVVAAVKVHPGLMSPVLLEYLLRGEKIGRMAEKGLLESPHHGSLRDVPSGAIAAHIDGLLASRRLVRASGFYPALKLAD